MSPSEGQPNEFDAEERGYKVKLWNCFSSNDPTFFTNYNKDLGAKCQRRKILLDLENEICKNEGF